MVTSFGRDKNGQWLVGSEYTLVICAAVTLDDIKRMQRETEIAHISSVLRQTHGRIRGKDGAAELLNEKPTTLESRMTKLGIKKEDFL